MNKKIIHIALGKANSERPNGVNKVVNSLVTHQVINGFNAEFWRISFSNEHNYPPRNYQTNLFMDQRNKFRLDEALKIAIENLNPLKTIFHIHGAFIPQFYVLSRLLKKRNIAYFFTPHEGYKVNALKRSKYIKLIYTSLFECALVNQAKGVQILGVSELIGAKKYFKNAFCLIPNGQELNETRTGNNNAKELIKVGFIGRMDIKTKGLDILLKGIRKAAQHMNIQLEIVGSGGDIATLKKRVTKLGLTQHVCFKGAIFGAEKLKFINTWDALCLTSRNEGIPGVVLEAASVGVPSIVSKETNMGKYIKNYAAGWVLKKNNSYNLVRAFQQLEYAKNTGTYLKYKAAAQTMFREEFDWNIIAKRPVTAYEKR
jgi:glycosyltransferase involved in cell wall biosynthesis